MLEEKKVSDVISGRATVEIEEDDIALKASKLMRSSNVGCLVVRDQKGKVAGVITERDLVRKIMASDLDPLEVRIRDVMTRGALAVQGQTPLKNAMKIMAEKRIRHLLVAAEENGEVIISGVLSGTDVLAAEFDDLRENLQKNGLENDLENEILSYLE